MLITQKTRWMLRRLFQIFSLLSFFALMSACSDGSEDTDLMVGKPSKARVIIYTHEDFNQHQVETILLPILPKQSVMYLRKLATKGHVVVIQGPDMDSVKDYLNQIFNLSQVKLLEQDAIFSIQEQ